MTLRNRFLLLIVPTTFIFLSARLYMLRLGVPFFEERAMKVHFPQRRSEKAIRMRYAWHTDDVLILNCDYSSSKQASSSGFTETVYSLPTNQTTDLFSLPLAQKQTYWTSFRRSLHVGLVNLSYILNNNSYKKAGISCKDVPLPTIFLDADTTLVDFAVSPGQAKGAWIQKTVTVPPVWKFLHRCVPLIPAKSQTRISLLVQTRGDGKIHALGSLSDWPEADDAMDTNLQWSPDGTKVSFIYHREVYLLPVP